MRRYLSVCLLCMIVPLPLAAQTTRTPAPARFYTLVPDFRPDGVTFSTMPDGKDRNKITYLFNNNSGQALVCSMNKKTRKLLPSPQGPFYFAIISTDMAGRIDQISIYNLKGLPAVDTTKNGASVIKFVVLDTVALNKYRESGTTLTDMAADSSGLQATVADSSKDAVPIIVQRMYDTNGRVVHEEPMTPTAYLLFQEVLVPQLFPKKDGAKNK